jgi:hypothetical protein
MESATVATVPLQEETSSLLLSVRFDLITECSEIFSVLIVLIFTRRCVLNVLAFSGRRVQK